MRHAIRALATAAALTFVAVPTASTAQAASPTVVRPSTPPAWQPLPASALDTMSEASLVRLHRQLAAHEDSLIRYARALLARGNGWNPRPVAGPVRAWHYAALVGGALAYNASCPLGPGACERDVGGYVDDYRSMDKVAHGGLALGLTALAIDGGVQPEMAALLTFGGSVLFEVTQAKDGGYYSSRDVVANGTGVAIAWGWHRWAGWRRARAERRAYDRALESSRPVGGSVAGAP